MDVLYMAAHYPLNPHDHVHSYPEQHLFTVDMVQNELQQKPHPFPQALPQYTSSPSMDSQADDDERLFDADVDFAIHPDSHHLLYDGMSSPPWASIATPRAWLGEAHKLPALEPDSRRSSFILPTDNTVTPQQESSTATNSSVSNIYTLDFYENGSPVRSPPISYLTTSSSAGVTAAMLSNTYYSEPQQPNSPYALASRYNNNTMAPSDLGCDPRFVNSASVSPIAGSSSPDHQSVGVSFADVYPDSSAIKVEQEQHSSLLGPGDVYSIQQITPYDTDSGEDEKSESESDPSYLPSSARLRPMSLPTSTRIHPRQMRSSSAGSGTPGLGNASHRPTRTPAPEPVPNLTKKSRGRRVPTAASLYGNYSVAGPVGNKNVRTYVCKVKDCGKCFARSEHLKRHVRSIHTNEKPHRCPHSGCNKEFSRHDNLCQHMRVHRNFSASKDGTYGLF